MLSAIEKHQVRASDFAVAVSHLPSLGADSAALHEHFAFFGPVQSVILSTDHSRLLRLLQRQQAHRARWRQLNLEYARAVHGLRASMADGGRRGGALPLQAASRGRQRQCDELLRTMGTHWATLLRHRDELRAAAAVSPAVCTGHAVVIFRRLEDAARCERHFELIRQHERSRYGGSAYPLDFRQLYFQSSHKLEVSRAPEPSDILWQNLRSSRIAVRTQNLKTTLFILLVSCVSTVLITMTTLTATMDSKGIVTTLWSTPVIIISNVVIFVSVPQLAIRLERHHTRSSQHMHMLLKMLLFQLFNTVVAVLTFMFQHWAPPTKAKLTCPLTHPPRSPANDCFQPSLAYLSLDAVCVKHWYTTGAAALISVVMGDMTAILGLIEFIRPDKLIVRYLIAPR